ncbi:MAG: DEAD/DEAH box helicase [Tannerella sp.]|jgi:ATP-dependent Lhr-like helicase|nr:DEAD/DEAH box helicase [Tannerella sp.]
MTAFSLLSEPIRKFIRDKGWEQLRPIQEAAITRILSTDDNYILSSKTASGKTEAAFLPILSKVNFDESGVQVLYISPLIALINDQFLRIEELCKYLDITVTKWHGEANKTLKNNLIRNPNGIVLITPESLEAMFVNKPFYVKSIFSNLKYIVVDEIHSFLGTDRGTQLKSILYRMRSINSKPFAVTGLSATIGNYDEAKKFTGNELKTKVLVDRTVKKTNVLFRYFKNGGEELPLDLLKDLYIETKDSKALIFPNSRGRAEEVAVKLKKISNRVKGHSNYFSHHSSIDREVREYVEHFAKNNHRKNFCISCTSTLELGIDIGTIDKVIQIDATHSVSSLVQRVGRSGRKDDECASLCLYATNKWDLLQSVACWILYREGYIESVAMREKPYDILVHQALSTVKSFSGIRLTDLVEQLHDNCAFNQIAINEIEQILHHLIEIDFLEQIQHEIIIGVEGEKIVNSRDFYSVFKTETAFKVINAGKIIGEIPFSPQVVEDANILLAARIWKIKYIDLKAKKIDVIPAKDGKKPFFCGTGTSIDSKIREKMLEIICDNADYDFLDQPGYDEIEQLRRDFSVFKLQNAQINRPLLQTENHLQFFSFAGTGINHTLQLLFDIAGIENSPNEDNSSFDIGGISKKEFLSKWNMLYQYISGIDTHIDRFLKKNPTLLDFSKYGCYLPEELQTRLLKNRYFDIEQTELFVKTIEIVTNEIDNK